MLTSLEFVDLLKREVVDDMVRHYRENLESQPRSIEHEPLKSMLPLWDRMSTTERSALVGLVRSVCEDVTSNVLGIVDGSSTLPGFQGDLCLGPVEDPLAWEGELQPNFWMIVELEASGKWPPDQSLPPL